MMRKFYSTSDERPVVSLHGKQQVFRHIWMWRCDNMHIISVSMSNYFWEFHDPCFLSSCYSESEWAELVLIASYRPPARTIKNTWRSEEAVSWTLISWRLSVEIFASLCFIWRRGYWTVLQYHAMVIGPQTFNRRDLPYRWKFYRYNLITTLKKVVKTQFFFSNTI